MLIQREIRHFLHEKCDNIPSEGGWQNVRINVTKIMQGPNKRHLMRLLKYNREGWLTCIN